MSEKNLNLRLGLRPEADSVERLEFLSKDENQEVREKAQLLLKRFQALRQPQQEKPMPMFEYRGLVGPDLCKLMRHFHPNLPEPDRGRWGKQQAQPPQPKACILKILLIRLIHRFFK